MLYLIYNNLQEEASFMEIIAFAVTFFGGLFATVNFALWINAPEAGPILAVCIMGTFIPWAIRHPEKK